MNTQTQNNPDGNSFDALIVGAGFAGLYQLHCLRDKLGMNVRVLEAGGDVGGTWYWNRYPGARCDTESHAYGFAFSDELYHEWEWSERYPEQPEILRHIERAAEKFDLKRDIQFNTRVIAAEWNEPARQWLVRTEAGETFSAPFLITAVGCLSAANVPELPGLESFQGDWYHTGQWPHEGVDFTGKRVGLIGTGSTGVQATPVIAEQAAHLTVFQRTPNYSVPARNVPLEPEFKRWVKDNADDIRTAMKETPSGHPFTSEERSAFEVSEEEREAIYQAAWEKGGLQFRSVFNDIMTSKAANDTAAKFVTAKIREVVKDPERARILTNFDHAYSGKRPIIDSHYFEAFNRDDVSLVDVRADPIEAITPTGLRTGETEHELDIIVFATGYDALTGPLLRMNISGRDGVQLAQEWKAGPRTYLGLQVAGFPNLFTITGPGSPSVLTNMPVSIEQHAEWITDCIEHMRDQGKELIETSPDAMDKWGEEVLEAASKTLLSVTESSWYLGANVPGKPRVFMPYPGGMAHYRKICAEVAAKGYEGFAFA